MFDLIKKYVAEKYMQFKNDQIWFGNERIVFYFAPHLAREFLINYNSNGLDYCANMFLAGKKQGFEFVKGHGIPLVKHLPLVVKISCEVLNIFGFGKIRTVKVDENENFMVLSGKSTFAMEVKSENPSKIPVDFMLGGLFAGAFQYYTKKDAYAVEISCVSQKENTDCVWIVGSKKHILDYIDNYSPEKKEWADDILVKIKKNENKLKKNGLKRWTV